jgi:hypothetical protein
MAAYTELHKSFLEQLGDDYNLGRILGAVGGLMSLPEGRIFDAAGRETERISYLISIIVIALICYHLFKF